MVRAPSTPERSRAPARLRRLPRFAWGAKSRRRTELGLLLFGDVVVVACYVLVSLGKTAHVPAHVGPFLGILLGLTLLAHLANRWLVPNANPVILPITALLNGIGYVMIARWDPGEAKAQAGWTAIGVVLYILTLLWIQHSRDLDRYRYLLLLAGVALVLAPLIPHFGESINGARLWVHVGAKTFQPVEVAKICLCIFFASYFAEKKELLSIATARIGNRLVIDPGPLIPVVLAWAFVMLVIGAEKDIGFALLIFALFVGLLWISTGRIGYLVFGLVLFAAGAFVASHLLGQVAERISIWLDPWKSASGNGFQLVQAWFALGNGGVGGVGLGMGHAGVASVGGGFVPEITSDMIFVAIGEELGLMGTSVVVIAFLLLVGSGLRIAQAARSDFSRLVATGLTLLIGLQAFFIMAGIVRILPLTGITLPFMAYGGSSLIANYVLVALLMRISEEGATVSAEQPSGVPQPGEAAFVVAG